MIQILEQNNYQVALDLARKELAALDPRVQAERCGCRLVESGDRRCIEVPYLDLTCRVFHPEGDMAVPGNESPLPLWEQILVLHYVVSTGDVPEEGDPIVFSQVPSGAFYDSAFQRRVKNHFLAVFGSRPDLLVPAARKLGGDEYKSGDVAVRIPAFPRVTFFFVFWKADDEFPADMNLLMSSTIASYLSTEDIAVLGGIAAGKLIKCAKALPDQSG